MGYTSESDSSRSSRHRKHKKSSRRSSKGRSRSSSPKRCKKKLKKYKRSNRSGSREARNSGSKSKHSRSRQRSRSTSERKKRRSDSRDESRDSRRKDDYKKSKYSKSKKKYYSSSSSSYSSSSKSKSRTPVRKFDYDPDELLQKLNKAAVEAMTANKKSKEDPSTSIEMQIKRLDTINELRADGSLEVHNVVAPQPPPPPLITSKLTEVPASEDNPVIVDLNTSGFTPDQASQSSDSKECLLHPNFMLESQEEKLNRWVKKLFQIRQRALSGEMVSI